MPARARRRGRRQTEAQLQIAAALGARAQVLPMSDEPVRTRVRHRAGWLDLQEYLSSTRRAPGIEVEFDGIDEASRRPEVPEALAAPTRS